MRMGRLCEVGKEHKKKARGDFFLCAKPSAQDKKKIRNFNLPRDDDDDRQD